ncbi:MAG: DUF3524 domain-containing protein [Bacteroidia bacterium]|nr:DUF3524 domain-containing protein [Bacteroidia bacterium]
MEGAAIELAQKVQQTDDEPDIFLVTDYLNLSLFKSLLPQKFQDCRFILYMHENQLTYPISKRDTDKTTKRDNHYGFINFTSCLVADRVVFNSLYHRDSFLYALGQLSKKLPETLDVKQVESKSSVIPLSIEASEWKNLVSIDKKPPKIIVWNHRWEYDKRPEIFLNMMVDLMKEGFEFNLVLLGKMDKSIRSRFKPQLQQLNDRILHLGFLTKRSDYLSWLMKSDILISMSIHDFFGISVLEGIYAGCQPILPKALAYPELLPTSLHDAAFYNKGELYSKIKKALSYQYWGPYEIELSRNYIGENFGWSTVGKKYEQIFQEVI